MRLKFVGCDRACDLHPFLTKLSKKGNVGVKILLDNVKFLLDIFHVLKHKEECCVPPKNSKCRYHPHLAGTAERFFNRGVWGYPPPENFKI